MTYDVILKEVGYQKMQVYKMVTELAGLGLRETKELVDTAPSVIKKDITKNEAKALKKSLEEIGAKVEISSPLMDSEGNFDLDKLRKLSQKGQSEIENQIKQKCSPQIISEKLMNDLEKKVLEATKKGERKAGTSFDIWSVNVTHAIKDTITGKTISNESHKHSGPLVDFSDRKKVSEVLFRMVKECITDKNIQFDLCESDYESSYSTSNGNYIYAFIEW